MLRRISRKCLGGFWGYFSGFVGSFWGFLGLWGVLKCKSGFLSDRLRVFYLAVSVVIGDFWGCCVMFLREFLWSYQSYFRGDGGRGRAGVLPRLLGFRWGFT